MHNSKKTQKETKTKKIIKTLNASQRWLVTIDTRRRSVALNLAQFLKCIGIAEVLFASVVSAFLVNHIASSFQKFLERVNHHGTALESSNMYKSICIIILHFIRTTWRFFFLKNKLRIQIKVIIYPFVNTVFLTNSLPSLLVFSFHSKSLHKCRSWM